MTKKTLQIELELGSHQLSASLQLDGGVTSRFTGKELVEGHVSIAAEDFEATQAIIDEARGTSTATDLSSGTVYSILSATLDFEEGEPTAIIRLREFEVLQATSVSLPGVELIPMLYTEAAFEPFTYMQILTEPLDAASGEVLNNLHFDNLGSDSYFDVVRHGVNESSVRMRFGRVLWEESEGGTRFLLTLVSEEGDSEDSKVGPPQPWEPQLNRAVDTSVELVLRLERVERALGKAGLMDAVQEPIDVWAKSAWNVRRRFNRVRHSLERFF